MNTKPRAAIIGYGYVGKAVGEFLKQAYDIVIYDPALGYADKEAANAAEFAVVCVPTPMQQGGAVDLSYIEETFSWLATPLIVVKSTIPPGTTATLAEKHGKSICFSPEYIGEGNYPVPYWDGIPHPTDMKYHSFHIFGGEKHITTEAVEYWKRAAGPFARFHECDATTAELVKYTENALIATKVTFVNELYDIAETFGTDFNELRELWLLDGRVGRSHTLVYKNNRGFGGKCIPKDTNGIVEAAKKKGYVPELLSSVLRINDVFVKKSV